MKIVKNIGNTERVIRIVAGLVFIALAFVGPANPWFLLGLIPVATGVIDWCPIYQALGINTKNKNKPSHP
ncbi:YgaP family membrane protein [Bdellovibrio svalbardensis]|uniref:DUF2892 domain-containing protein n=1 Tax=Bdellovibrio svalbardensis TaxID=2972972 RepID=A0ABT6DNV9_9BACT|nr:DUF2892 domain-containing protein [Bdellovibrio svalbardensis]MDG0817609.1 DUF2892 domain-containing protein [Bdellovibrio svalbardensis]